MEGPSSSTQDTARTRHCLACGYRSAPWATTCSLCGQSMRDTGVGERPAFLPAQRAERMPNPWAVLGIGAALAPALGLLPILQYVGWFLASLVHEIGHCIVAWTFGAPAYPAIRIDGHAAAIHGDQKVFLVGVVWLILLWVGWSVRHRPRLRIVLAVALVLHPLMAFSKSHDILHLLAGHMTELAFAGLAFHRAFSGGFTESTAERITYAAVAWFLLGKNVIMNFGLMTSESARQTYLGNGSFGLEQDFIRAARELGWSLSSVGGLMLLLSLAVLPALWFLWTRMADRTASA